MRIPKEYRPRQRHARGGCKWRIQSAAMSVVERVATGDARLDQVPASMLAGVLVAPRALELRSFAVPLPGPGQVLVRVKATALCTWEQRTYLGIQDVKTPFVGGHETAGVVAAVGEGVRLV